MHDRGMTLSANNYSGHCKEFLRTCTSWDLHASASKNTIPDPLCASAGHINGEFRDRLLHCIHNGLSNHLPQIFVTQREAPPRVSPILNGTLFAKNIVVFRRAVMQNRPKGPVPKSMGRCSTTLSPKAAGEPFRRMLTMAALQSRNELPHIRGGWDDPYRARPTRAFGGRAFRVHGDRPNHPDTFFSILLEKA